MQALLFILIAFAFYVLAYRFYAGYLSEKIWRLDPGRRMPAVEFDDGFEFVPTRREIVLGHHFVSIAGAAPIVGPVVAAIWGWLPALLWVVLGTIFLGAVHDLGILVTSIRHQGRGVADYIQDIMGRPAARLMYIVVFFLLVLVSAVFIHVIAVLAERFPAAVYSIWAEIPLAIIIGLMVRRKVRVSMLLVSAAAVAVMYFLIWVGSVHPLALSYRTWVWIFLVYMAIAARLPVWMLVQPRDFINAVQLVVALVVCSLGIIIFAFTGGGQLAAPAVRWAPEGAPPIWPFIFITIGCGAISGWHSIVAGGTTPKQLTNEADARAVGYGSMLGEGYLAVIALLTAVVGLGSAGYRSTYAAWGTAAWPAVWAEGGGVFVAALGIPAAAAAAFMAVVAKSFVMTTLDSAMRFTRISVAEFSHTFNLPKFMRGRTGSLVIGWIIIAWIALSGYGMKLWPLFGAANQILAALGLFAASVFLLGLGRSTKNYLIPFFIMIITSMYGMGYEIFRVYVPEGSWLLAIIGLIVFSCGAGLLVIGKRVWNEKKAEFGNRPGGSEKLF